jgi:hypothetical protein
LPRTFAEQVFELVGRQPLRVVRVTTHARQHTQHSASVALLTSFDETARQPRQVGNGFHGRVRMRLSDVDESVTKMLARQRKEAPYTDSNEKQQTAISAPSQNTVSCSSLQILHLLGPIVSDSGPAKEKKHWRNRVYEQN